ncbi:hypothetical protein Tco_0599452 [Tanacetum coccineum]
MVQETTEKVIQIKQRSKPVRDRAKEICRFVSVSPIAGKGWICCLQVELPQELSRVHNTFHVSNLKKCYSDEPLAASVEGLQWETRLHFVEEPMEIMDREVKWLKQIRIPIVKVNEARDPVMSSSSTVTYTSVYTDSEPGRVFWGADEELSNRVLVEGEK